MTVQVAPADKADPHVFPCAKEGSPLMVIPAIPTGAPLVLVTVTVWLGLSPIMSTKKLSVVGDKLRCRGRVPVPVRVTVCDAPELPESSLRVRSPLAGPATAGAKDTLAVQLAPATRLFGQLFVSGNPSLAAMLEKFSGLPPKFVIVTGWELLEVPISWLAKVKVVGEKLIAEGRGLGSGI